MATAKLRPGVIPNLDAEHAKRALQKPCLRVEEFAAFQLGEGLDGFAGFFLGEAQVIEILEIEPELGAGSEEVS